METVFSWAGRKVVVLFKKIALFLVLVALIFCCIFVSGDSIKDSIMKKSGNLANCASDGKLNVFVEGAGVLRVDPSLSMSQFLTGLYSAHPQCQHQTLLFNGKKLEKSESLVSDVLGSDAQLRTTGRLPGGTGRGKKGGKAPAPQPPKKEEKAKGKQAAVVEKPKEEKGKSKVTTEVPAQPKGKQPTIPKPFALSYTEKRAQAQQVLVGVEPAHKRDVVEKKFEEVPPLCAEIKRLTPEELNQPRTLFELISQYEPVMIVVIEPTKVVKRIRVLESKEVIVQKTANLPNELGGAQFSCVVSCGSPLCKFFYFVKVYIEEGGDFPSNVTDKIPSFIETIKQFNKLRFLRNTTYACQNFGLGLFEHANNWLLGILFDFCEYGSLADNMEAIRALPFFMKAKIYEQCFRAVNIARLQTMFYRELTPAKILIKKFKIGQDIEIALGGFERLKRKDESNTVKPIRSIFFAPETELYGFYDEKVDVWSLSLILLSTIKPIDLEAMARKMKSDLRRLALTPDHQKALINEAFADDKTLSKDEQKALILFKDGANVVGSSRPSVETTLNLLETYWGQLQVPGQIDPTINNNNNA